MGVGQQIRADAPSFEMWFIVYVVGQLGGAVIWSIEIFRATVALHLFGLGLVVDIIIKPEHIKSEIVC